MFRRAIIVIVAAVALVAVSAAPAFAWANGGDGGNAYGTHDWVLEHAIKLAGSKASWVDVPTALLASDDPDGTDGTHTATSSLLHVYYDSTYVAQGGPNAAAQHYYRLVTAYKAGNYKEASRQLGLMSHYYADVTQPFHTYKDQNKTLHESYEHAVSDETRTYAMSSDLLVVRSRKSVTDVRAYAVAAGKYSRARYDALETAYSANKVVTKSNPTARAITRYTLSRATNDLADIICAVPAGAGIAKAPAKMTQKMSKTIYRYPRKGQYVQTTAVCKDASGNPMQGVAVRFTWPTATGTQSETRYTDADGYVYRWFFVAPLSNMKRYYVTARAASSGAVTSSSTSYLQSPVLADGTAGAYNRLNETRPKQNTVVKAKATFKSTSGKPVAGLPVTFKWTYKSYTKSFKTVTDEYGVARCSMNIGNATKGYRCYVRARAYSGGHRRSYTRSFIPQ